MTNKLITFGAKDCKVIEREILYENFFRLVRVHVKHRLFNGGWSEVFPREICERFDAAAVLPYDPKLDRVILIEQFRAGTLYDPTSPWQIEIPAGILGKNETPLEVGIREAKEEAGCDVINLKFLYEYFVTPGWSDEYLHVFYGEVDASRVDGVHGLKNEHEDIRVINISADEAFERLHNREIRNGPAIIALQWLEANRDKLKR